jgi:hypothetical protein
MRRDAPTARRWVHQRHPTQSYGTHTSSIEKHAFQLVCFVLFVCGVLLQSISVFQSAYVHVDRQFVCAWQMSDFVGLTNVDVCCCL